MTRDRVTYRVTRGAHSVRLVPMQKLVTDEPTEQDLITQAMDFMGTCAAEPECMYGLGTIVYNSVGNYIWINWTP